jgi:Ser-tRNA(Ala) deacylase AlaX
MNTNLLYQTDGYLKQFSATVKALQDGALVLDQTAFFYPGGGGQPADGGFIRWDGQEIPLRKIEKNGGTHVANTREVGRIKIIGHECKGKINKRLRIVLE